MRDMGRTSAVVIPGAIACVLCLAGCVQDPVGVSPGPPVPVVSAERLADAPAEITPAGLTFVIEETYLWRDFQPSWPPGDGGLMAVIRVAEADSMPIPPGTHLAYLWVRNGDEVWGTSFAEPPQPGWPPHVLVRVARGGPAWGPHIFVDVVVGIRAADGGVHLLAARDQWIHRTD